MVCIGKHLRYILGVTRYTHLMENRLRSLLYYFGSVDFNESVIFLQYRNHVYDELHLRFAMTEAIRIKRAQ